MAICKGNDECTYDGSEDGLIVRLFIVQNVKQGFSTYCFALPRAYGNANVV